MLSKLDISKFNSLRYLTYLLPYNRISALKQIKNTLRYLWTKVFSTEVVKTVISSTIPGFYRNPKAQSGSYDLLSPKLHYCVQNYPIIRYREAICAQAVLFLAIEFLFLRCANYFLDLCSYMYCWNKICIFLYIRSFALHLHWNYDLGSKAESIHLE